MGPHLIEKWSVWQAREIKEEPIKQEESHAFVYQRKNRVIFSRFLQLSQNTRQKCESRDKSEKHESLEQSARESRFALYRENLVNQ